MRYRMARLVGGGAQRAGLVRSLGPSAAPAAAAARRRHAWAGAVSLAVALIALLGSGYLRGTSFCAPGSRSAGQEARRACAGEGHARGGAAGAAGAAAVAEFLGRREPAAPSPPGPAARLGLGAAGALCAAGIALALRAAARGGPAKRRTRQGGRDPPSGVGLRAVAGMRIVGTGSCAPESVVTNDHLAEIVDTSDEWIQQRTGIRCRHILGPEETLGSISTIAAQRALDKAGVSAEDVDMVILATSTPDDLFGTATAIAAGVGATKAVAFDLTAACSGFVFGLVTAAQYMRNGASKTTLVVGADCLSRWVDWSDRGTCVLFGDGAGAVVLQETAPENDSLIGFEMGSDGGGRGSLYLPTCTKAVALGGGNEGANGGYTHLGMNGTEVFRFATSTVNRVLRNLLDAHSVKPEEIDWLLLHQANRRIMDSAAKKLKLPLEKVLCNLDEYGNTSAGSIPLALDEAVRDGRVKPGQLVACMGFGAGLSWGGALLRM